jgi:Endosomal/lysosomal potassium channel TMEM175
MQTHYNTLAGEEVGRIAALSDGIFAIAATILVLDFHTPEPTDIHSEAELLPRPRCLSAKTPAMAPEQLDARHLLAWPADPA